MVVSGALSLGPTYHATLSSLSLSLSLSLFRSSFSRFHAEPSWLNPRLSYFTVKIVECSVRAVSREENAPTVEARLSMPPPPLSLSLVPLSVRAFSDFLSTILPSEESFNGS